MACIMASKTISVCTIIFIEKENAYYKTHLHYLNLTFKPPKRKINYKKLLRRCEPFTLEVQQTKSENRKRKRESASL